MDVDSLYQVFTTKLQVLYGDFDADAMRFTGSSNSDISRELGYSDAQFSRLIHKHATEGEYQRAIQNTERIIRINELEERLSSEKSGSTWHSNPIAIIAYIIIVAVATVLLTRNYDSDTVTESIIPRDHTIEWAFNSNFVDPFVGLDELPEDCDFPCYKYQGTWSLKDPYKLPFFMEKTGYHYLATDVRMYARCMIENSTDGDVVEGFEYQMHEIWYDTRELPMDSFMLSDQGFKLAPAYLEIDFENDTRFIKVASIHTFFRNQFVIDSAIVKRTGKVIGRDIEPVTIDELVEQGIERSKAEKISSDLVDVSADKMRDFSNPIECELTQAPRIDFHRIAEGDLMSFNCQLTTNRVGIGYNKVYQLVDQQIKNTCQ